MFVLINFILERKNNPLNTKASKHHWHLLRSIMIRFLQVAFLISLSHKGSFCSAVRGNIAASVETLRSNVGIETTKKRRRPARKKRGIISIESRPEKLRVEDFFALDDEKSLALEEVSSLQYYHESSVFFVFLRLTMVHKLTMRLNFDYSELIGEGF